MPKSTAQQSFSGFTDRQKHLAVIRNAYWQLRMLRPGQQARRRQLYRQIAKQKAVLIADGLELELLRLWCRQYSACHREAARGRFEAELQKSDSQTQKTLKA